MKTSFVARQPILDSNKNIYGYELLFRDGEDNSFPSVSDEEATNRLIYDNFFTTSDNRSLLDDKMAFINFSHQSLVNLVPSLLPSEHLVVEILETCEPTSDLLFAIKKLKKRGYKIALDDFVPSPAWRVFLPFIDVIKFDIQAIRFEQVEHFIRKVKGSKIQFLAEKVETEQEYQKSLSIGFELFQGYFFAKPEMLKNSVLTTGDLASIKLFKEISKSDLDLQELEKIFSSDVGLSFNLLRCVNSANVANSIKSIKQAFTFLGDVKLRKFISLVALANVSKDKPEVLYQTSVARGRFCQLLALRHNSGMNSNEAYLAGMLSLLDVMLITPFETIFSSISLEPHIEKALENGSGQLGLFLELAQAYEKADWRTVSQLNSKLNMDPMISNECHYDALSWEVN
ncbi:EAL domain-containing protein [Vibrio sp. YMD68]|uniref:EAL and HDOD domain-containing protein n=1 Tax=Vibrio sp. YMD68 TaxID=3042300 RepID=UPI00249A4F35|nr:HDOD domain-containing protein [Vibrio sp. YMD68]WGV98300.1 EAL domain-containing protein [Vibrio sp. YMD68]